MAVESVTIGDDLTRDGAYLDTTNSFTIVAWTQLVTAQTDTNFTTARVFGDPLFADPYLFVGTYTDGTEAQFFLELFDGVDYFDPPISVVTPGTWYGYAVVYDQALGNLRLYLLTTPGSTPTLVGTITYDLSALTFPTTTETTYGDPASNVRVGSAYDRVFASALTPTQIAAELASPDAVLTALADTPLYEPGDLRDRSGNGHDWTIVAGIAFIAGPLTLTFSGDIFCCADGPLNPSRQLYGFVPTDGAVAASHETLLSITSGISNVPSCQRATDAHVFLASGSGWVFEWDASLNQVQQFGGTSSSAPGTLYPTDDIWTLMGIQFTASACWLFWVGNGFGVRDVAVQQRHPTTLALVNQYLIDQADLPGNKEMGMVNRAGTVAFTNGTGGSIVNQNVIWSYTIATTTVAAWGAFGSWTPNTGDYVHEFRVCARTDDRIVALYYHATSGLADDCQIVVFNASGVVINNFALEDSETQLVDYMGLSADERFVWTSQLFSGDASTFRKYNLLTGAKVAEFVPPAEAPFGWLWEYTRTSPPPPGPGTTRAIRRVRQFLLPSSDSHRAMFIPELEVLLQTGIGLIDPDAVGYDPQVMLQVSTDGGKTFGTEQWASAGKQGDYTARVRFRRTPNRYRDGVVRIVMTDPVDWTLVDVVAPKASEGTS